MRVGEAGARALRLGRHTLELTRPRVMGILNATPDSFSDGGKFVDRKRALARARQMLADGADIIDVGGESTRPGAAPVSPSDELERVIPIVEALATQGACVSVDTMKPEVMRAAARAGASMINDVRALQEPGALETIASLDIGVCLMHMQGTPATMQRAPCYEDVVTQVRCFLIERAQACIDAGIVSERICIDPGFGFGKTAAHNLTLLHELLHIAGAGYPVLVGLSRKSSLGSLTGRDPGDRLGASIAAALMAVARGAAIVRVHDVRETVDALKVWHAVEHPPSTG